MNLLLALNHLFPDASPLKDYTLVDNGAGAFIGTWNLPQKKPSVDELTAAYNDALLKSCKKDAIQKIETYSRSKRTDIAGTEDEIEIGAWNNKLRIAQSIINDTASESEIDIFKSEILARAIPGETLEIFVNKVINNGGFFAKAVALIDGIKRRSIDEVNAATTIDEVKVALDHAEVRAVDAFSGLLASNIK